MADGKVNIKVDAETRQAQKNLSSLSREITAQEKVLSKLATAYATLSKEASSTFNAEQLKGLTAELSKYEAELAKAKEQQAQLQSSYGPEYAKMYEWSQKQGVNKGLLHINVANKGLDWGKYQAYQKGIEASLERINGLEFNIANTKQKMAAFTVEENALLKEAEASLKAQQAVVDDLKAKYAAIQQDMQNRADWLNYLREDAQKAQPELANLQQRIEYIKSKMAELQSAGVGEGYQAYEKLRAQLVPLEEELEAYIETQREVAEASLHTKSAVQLLGEFVRGLGVGMLDMAQIAGKTVLVSLKLLAKTLKQIGQIGIKAVGGILKKSISALISPFKKAAKAATGFGKRLKTAILQGLVFRQVRTALSNLVQGMGAMIKTNAEVSAAFAQLKGTAITAFQPFVTAIVPIIKTFVNWIQIAINAISKLLGLLGMLPSMSKQEAKAMYDQAKATEAAGGAADAFTASWDTLQKVSSSGGGGGGETAPTFDFDTEDPIGLENLADLIAGDHWFIIGQLVEEKLNGIMTTMSDWVSNKFNPWLASFGTNFADLLNGMMFRSLSDPSNVSFGELAATFFNGIINGFTNFVTTFSWKWLGDIIAQNINDFFSTFDAEQLSTGISAFVKGIFTTITHALEETDWNQIGTKVAEFIRKIDWSGITGALFRGIGAAIGGLAQFLWGLIKDAWSDVVDWWHDVAYEDGEFTIEGLLDGIRDKCEDIYFWIKDHIFTPFINGFKKAFGIASPSKEMKPYGEYVIEGMLEGIKSKLSSVGEWIKTNVFDPIINGIKTAFGITENSSSEMEASGEAIAGGIANGISSGIQGVKNAINSIIDVIEQAVNWIIDKINSVKLQIPTNDVTSFLGIAGFGWDGFNLPKVSIPRLAQGSVVNPGHEFAAILGDNRYEKEVVSPLSTMKQAVAEALAESNYARGGSITLQVDGKTFARIMNPYLTKETSRIGIVATGGTA